MAIDELEPRDERPRSLGAVRAGHSPAPRRLGPLHPPGILEFWGAIAQPVTAMRVLMLGWDFSPRLSGGVGSACRGLALALTRAPEPLRTEVLFVLPRLRGDEASGNVQLLGTDPL